jgi:hypothetical protein
MFAGQCLINFYGQLCTVLARYYFCDAINQIENKLDCLIAQQPHMYPPVDQNSPFPPTPLNLRSIPFYALHVPHTYLHAKFQRNLLIIAESSEIWSF